MMLMIFILSFFLNASNPVALQVELNEEKYLVKEQPAAGKRKLIVFSGSDWCKNCILFKKEVLNSEVFQEFVKENIEIVTADFPQKKQLSHDEVVRNEALADKYNQQGEFPKFVLLSADESKTSVIPYKSQNAEQFIAELKSLLGR